jgi:hypothetical protein
VKQESITRTANQIESLAVDIIAILAPWLSPLPSAYLVYRATQEHFGWPFLVSAAGALAVEAIGVVSVVVALRLHEWNQTKNSKEPAAPFGLAVAVCAFYLVVTVGLVVFLKVFPELVNFAPAVFPFLAITGAVNIALKDGQKRRERERQERKEERKQARQDTRKVTGNLPQVETAEITDWRQFSKRASRDELLEIAGMDTTGIMETYRLDNARTARNWRQNARQLTANGHSNGAH